jgi:hypothetical protein
MTITTSSSFPVRSFRGVTHQPAPPADGDEQKELDVWVKRYQPELGLLQSPPTGPAGPKARVAQTYVNDLVKQLAGEQLEKGGIELRVEIFSGDIAQADLDDTTRQERQWERKHPDKPWPIRTWLDAPKDGSKPLYRLALNQGLLETLKTREELGFVVAHQLQELLEHHAADPHNEEELKISRKSFVDSREAQLANDAKALKMMTAAGLNPQGALGALDKLYRKFAPQYPADDQKAALVAAAQIQEHEGIRTSAMQFQVEDLRRKGHPSTANPVQEIPAAVVAPATGDYQGRLDNFPAFTAAMNNAASGLATEQTPDWMFGDRSKSPELALLKTVKPNPQEYEAALLGVCEHLTATVADPQHRVNGLLRLAIALDGECLPNGFSPEGQQQLRDFLSANDFSAERFLTTLSKDGKSLHRELARNVQLTETFQSVAAPLYQPGKDGISRLVDQTAASFCRHPETGQHEIEALPMFLSRNNNDEHETRALVERYNESSLALLRAEDPQKLARELDEVGLPRGLGLGNAMREVDDLEPDFRIALRETMQPIEQASHAVREDNARLRLRPPLVEPVKLGAYLEEFFASEAGGEFSQEFERDLKPLMLDLVRSCNSQPDLLFDSGRPRSLDQGLERRLTEMLGTVEAKDKAEIARFLARTWAHELRVPTNSDRREFTGQLGSYLQSLGKEELVRQLSTEDTAQHAAFFRKTLLEGYLLSEDALPDTSTASLAALEKRVSAGEFEPKRDQFSDRAEYEKARKAYRERQDKMKKISAFLAPAEARLVLSKLAVLGHDPRLSLEVASSLSAPEFLSILSNTEQVVERSKTVRKVSGDNGLEVVGTDAGTFLLDGFLAVEKSFDTIDEFYDLARRTAEMSPGALESRADTRGRMAEALYARLQKLEEPDKLREWLGKERVLETLKPEQTSNLLIRLLGELAKPGADPAALGAAVKELDGSYSLKEKHGLAYVLLRDSVTERVKLQPGNLNLVFPPDESGPVDHLAQFKVQLSALSGLIAMTRNHSPKEQLATIEYLMGRSEEMPKFLEQASENQSLGPIAQTIRNARQSLTESDIAVRVMIANSFLAGPNGLLQQEGGKDAVLNHFLANVEQKSLKLARPITQAILVSQGDADSLAVAVVLGQRPKKRGDSSGLTEADILSRVFDSYGVPGIKMKQYLAFTSQFAQYREAFESAQDAANPLNYFETLRLIQARFGDEWPDDMVIDRVLGSGSVNVAIRYTNKATGQREVVSLGREAIEEQTNYDFARFNKFVDALTASDEGRASFGFIKGLTGIIEDSVALEFDKEAVKDVQKAAFETYKHTFKDGWTLRSIDAYQVKNLGLFMEEAKGVTARKTLTTKPELYKVAMRHMAEAEFNLLKGRDATGNIIPKPNFANPDIHDGQVLIEEETKTVTVLDFGQAVPITNKERELALDLMVVLGKLNFAGGAAKLLNKRFFPKAKPGEGITKEDIKAIRQGSTQKMDMFIRLLALISQRGAKVPLSTVHWILALNRQVVLGEKLEQSINAEVAGMAITKRLGLPLTVYNAAQQAVQTTAQVAGAVVGGIAGFFTALWPFGSKEAEPEVAAVGQPGALGGLRVATLAGPGVTGAAQQPAEKPVEKPWRKKDSWGFYLDDFGS